MAQRVDAFALGGFLVLREKFLHAGKVQRGLRHPEVIVDDPVEHRTQVLLDGRELQPDHTATEHLGLEAHLIRCLDHAHGIRRIRAHVHDIRIRGLNGANDRGVIGGRGRIGLVVHDLHAEPLGVLACAPRGIQREFRIGRHDGNRLGLGILCHREIEKALRPVGLGLRPGRHDLEITVIVELVIYREPEERRKNQLFPHDDRHRRRNFVGAVARHHQIHFVDLQKLGVDRRNLRRLRRVIVVDELDRATEQPAFLVGVIAPDLHRDERGLARAGETTGQRHAETDLDRFLGGERAA